MLESVFSVSDDLEPIVGVKQVVADCRRQLGERSAQAGFFFTSCLNVDYEPMLAEICREFPGVELIGCTTDGEITMDRGLTEDSSALLLICSEDVRLSSGVAENISGDTRENMRAGFDEALKNLGTDPSAAFVLPESLTTMGISLDTHLREVFGRSLPVFGGSAGDGFELKKTYQFHGDKVFTDAMPFLLLGGQLDIAVSIAKGPLPYGDYFKVDKAEGNTVYAIDGVTALSFFERFMGKYLDQKEFSLFPLAVYSGDSDDFYLRDPVEINKEDGSITFFGHFEEPCRVRLADVSREETLKSAHLGAGDIFAAFENSQPELVLVFSCTSRKHILGSRSNQELEGLKKGGKMLCFFGFYCYGEFGPFSVGQPVTFHSNTCVFVGLSSRN